MCFSVGIFVFNFFFKSQTARLFWKYLGVYQRRWTGYEESIFPQLAPLPFIFYFLYVLCGFQSPVDYNWVQLSKVEYNAVSCSAVAVIAVVLWTVAWLQFPWLYWPRQGFLITLHFSLLQPSTPQCCNLPQLTAATLYTSLLQPKTNHCCNLLHLTAATFHTHCCNRIHLTAAT